MKKKRPDNFLIKDGSYPASFKTGVYSKGQEDNIL